MNGGGGKASTRLLPSLCRQLPPARHWGYATARFSIENQPELLRRFWDGDYLPCLAQLVTFCPRSVFLLSSGEINNLFIFADVPQHVRSSRYGAVVTVFSAGLQGSGCVLQPEERIQAGRCVLLQMVSDLLSVALINCLPPSFAPCSLIDLSTLSSLV